MIFIGVKVSKKKFQKKFLRRVPIQSYIFINFRISNLGQLVCVVLTIDPPVSIRFHKNDLLTFLEIIAFNLKTCLFI